MRRTQLKRRPLKPARVIEADIWRQGLGPCIHCGPTLVDGHHVIPAQTLRRHGLHEYLMDRRNRVALCRAAHDAHHNRTRPLTRGELPVLVFEFADEVGLGWYLDRHYPGEQ